MMMRSAVESNIDDRFAHAFRAGATLLFAVMAPACISSSPAPTTPVANVPPVAAFVYSPVSPIQAGQTQVAFNGSQSADSDGTVVSYIWDFGDTTPQQTVATPTITHVFPVTTSTCVDITYTVLLTVTDNGGARGSTSNTIVVTQPCPQ